jgi:hypothetical protein
MHRSGANQQSTKTALFALKEGPLAMSASTRPVGLPMFLLLCIANLKDREVFHNV